MGSVAGRKPQTVSAVLDEKLGCEDLRAAPSVPGGVDANIELRMPKADKTIVLSKTGVIVTFSRDDFLTAARCLRLQQAENYIETQTGDTKESPLRDAFQLSYVAAALLETGRVEVRHKDERQPRSSIVRESWSADGCAGQCRSFGRVYRLSDGDSSFFFRVTDRTENFTD